MKINYLYFIVFIGVVSLTMIILYPSDKDMGQYYFQSREYENAIISFEKVLSRDSENRLALENLRKLYQIVGEPDKEITILKKLIQKFPEKIELQKELAEIYEWEGWHQEAFRLYQKLYAYNPKNKIYLRKLKQYSLLQSNINNVILFTERELAYTDDSLFVLNELLKYTLSTGETEKSIGIYKQICKIKPSQWQYRFALANLYISKKNKQDAIKTVWNYINENKKTLESFENAFNFFKWNNLYDESITLLLAQVEQYPQNYELYEDISDVYVAMGSLNEGVTYLERFLHYDKGNSRAQKKLNKLYQWTRGGGGESIRETMASVLALYKKNPSDMTLVKKLAQFNEWNSNTEGAIHYYKILFENSKKLVYGEKIYTLYGYIGRIDERIEYSKIILGYNLSYDKKNRYMKDLLNLYLAQGDKENIVPLYHYFIKEKIDEKRYLKDLADHFRWGDEPDSAMVYYSQLEKIGTLPWESSHFLGEYYFSKSKFKKAIHYFHNVLSEKKSHRMMHHFLAEAYDGIKDFTRGGFHRKQAFHFLKNKRRSYYEHEVYLLLCVKLEKYPLFMREIYQTPQKKRFLMTHLDMVLYNLFSHKQYDIAGDLLAYYQVLHRGFSQKQIAVIQEQARVLSAAGRWDLANHLNGYVQK